MKKDKIFVGAAISIVVILLIFIISAVIIEINNVPELVLITDNGDIFTTIKIKDGKPASIPQEPTRDGYTFNGWYTDNTYSNLFSFSDIETESDILIYARWEINTYAVTFDTNGGIPIDAVIVEHNKTLKRPTNPTRFGYQFENWYSDSILNNTYDFNNLVTSDLSIYASWIINKYTVTFNSNGGNIIAPISPEHGNIIAEPVAPTRVNYIFEGWYTDILLTEAYNFQAIVTDNMNLYAKWSPSYYSFTFDYLIDEMVVQVHANSKITPPNTLIREGYTFDNWYIDEAMTILYDFDTLINASIRVYGNWIINQYIVNYDSNYGTSVLGEITNYNTIITPPDEPERIGYEFTGWYYNDVLFDFVNTPITSNIEFIADWAPLTYTITFDTQGGVLENNTTTVVFESLIGIMPIPSKLHYDFVNWNTIYDGTGSNLDENSIYEIAGDITLYAQYTYTTYNVSFNGNGGNDIASVSSLYNTSIIAPLETPIKTGYTFNDWYIDEESNDLYDFNTPLNGDITLYAGWEINQYTVTFNSQDGSNVDSITTNYMTNITSPVSPIKTGNDFQGWYYNDTIFDFETLILDHITLYAEWELINYYLTFNAEGGTVTPNYKLVNYQLEIGDLPVPNKAGHTFIEWNEKADGTGEIYDSIKVYALTENTTIHAIWEINKYTVEFDSNGGNTVSSIENVLYNTLISEPEIPIRQGYQFIKWFINIELTMEFTFDSAIIDDMTLYAGWEAKSYILNYNANGGSVEPSFKTIKYGLAIDTLATPTRFGYEFVEWNSSMDGTEDVYDSNTIYSKDDNSTIFAQWSPITYTITYVTYQGVNGNNPLSYTIMTDDILLEQATKTGYNFSGWYDNSEYNGSAITTIELGSIENMILYAKWTAINYVINYYLDSGSNGNNPATYTIEDDNITLDVSIKTGYNFDGWYNNDLFETEIQVISSGSYGVINLYAKWNIVVYTVSFDSREGSSVDDIDADYNTLIDKPIDPTRDHYEFMGWYKDNSIFVKLFDFDNETIIQDITLYAYWEAIDYNITYVLDGGAFEGAYPNTYTYEDNITLIIPAKIGYDFIDWFLDDEFTYKITNISAGSYGNITLYALWELTV